MIDIKEYILLEKFERQKHLRLEEPCCERGGKSTQHKGVLAQYLNTTIPSGRILLCHACNNADCSNPNHLYFGTDRENIIEDGKKFGTFRSPWESMVAKHGYERACQMQSRKSDHSKAGKANTKPKSEEHKRKISEAIKRKHAERIKNNPK